MSSPGEILRQMDEPICLDSIKVRLPPGEGIAFYNPAPKPDASFLLQLHSFLVETELKEQAIVFTDTCAKLLAPKQVRPAAEVEKEYDLAPGTLTGAEAPIEKGPNDAIEPSNQQECSFGQYPGADAHGEISPEASRGNRPGRGAPPRGKRYWLGEE